MTTRFPLICPACGTLDLAYWCMTNCGCSEAVQSCSKCGVLIVFAIHHPDERCAHHKRRAA